MRPAAGGRTTVLVLAAAAAVAAAPGCAPARSRGRAARGDRTVLTQAQLRTTGFTNLYDALTALRSNWLRPRTVDSFDTPTPVWVYVDNVRLGGVETLRNLSPLTTTYVRYFDGTAASARWGIGHGQGVIFVSAAPR